MITKLAKDYSGLTDQELNNEAVKGLGLGVGGASMGMAGGLASGFAVPSAAINTAFDYKQGAGTKGQKLLAAAKGNKGAIGAAAGAAAGMGAGLGAMRMGVNRLRDIESELQTNRPHLIAQAEGLK